MRGCDRQDTGAGGADAPPGSFLHPIWTRPWGSPGKLYARWLITWLNFRAYAACQIGVIGIVPADDRFSLFRHHRFRITQ